MTMKFTETHEWVEVQEKTDKVGTATAGTATVGISDFAQKELGDIVYVELPKVGKQIKAKEEAVVLESTKAAVDIYSPLSGTIAEVNTALREFPEKINQSAEKEGWLFKITFNNPAELDALMDEKSYRTFIKSA